MIIYGEGVPSYEVGEGVSRKILTRGGGLMMVEVTFKEGAVGALHQHFHEQISYIIKGSFQFELDGNVQKVTAGDSIYVPSNAAHGVRSLEEGSVILDVFSPQREDFLE
ncbi:cupin domain-containing protein [Cytobacillus gottheilii]|uniref:Cupin domain-containing protein n=1 Tax=Cytobacillus gottheilii TaxID=859144 RepID=A0ABX8FCL4_9BACI|nr:cupin domain-containing protein [Cytobacillus gottheilii]QVY61825.1 cupin domain-containing protein [Cytobacillus gottheilii]